VERCGRIMRSGALQNLDGHFFMASGRYKLSRMSSGNLRTVRGAANPVD
jgi:hypothetical protein